MSAPQVNSNADPSSKRQHLAIERRRLILGKREAQRRAGGAIAVDRGREPGARCSGSVIARQTFSGGWAARG